MDAVMYDTNHTNPHKPEAGGWLALEQMFSELYNASSPDLDAVAINIASFFSWDQMSIEDISGPALASSQAKCLEIGCTCEPSYEPRPAMLNKSLLSIVAPSGAPFSAITFIRSEEEPWTTDEKASASLAGMLLVGLYSEAGPACAHDIFDPQYLEEKGLTPREIEVFTLLAAGHTSQQTAFKLDISPRTVEKHSQNIYRNLGVKNLSAAMSSLLRA